MPERDVAAWNALLSGYSRNGYVEQAISLFAWMRSCGETPNSLTLSVLLQVCASGVEYRRLGRCLHGYICRRGGGDDFDVFLDNSLLDFYCKCGDVEVAKRVFERMPVRDLVSWNVMTSGYSRNGCAHMALRTFRMLREEGFSPDSVTLETALRACALVGDDIEVGELIHGFMIVSGFSLDVYLANSLLLMYSKCGDMESMGRVFDRMLVRNLVSWNILIDGLIQRGQPQKALALFRLMRSTERQVSSSLLVSALKAIKLLGGCQEEQVMCIHCLVIATGFDLDEFVSSSLIAAYGECGDIATARRCFDYFTQRMNNYLVCCNAMVSVYLLNWCLDEAWELLQVMQLNSCKGDSVTFVNALLICAQQSDLRQGKLVHGYIIRNWFDSSVIITTMLLELYIKCGLLTTACLLFSRMSLRNTVSWNTMIFGCCKNGFPRVSLSLFHHLIQLDGVMPDATCLVGVIDAISQRGFHREGKYIHDYAVSVGLDKNEFVTNALIAMYMGLGDFYDALSVFDAADKLRTVTWNTMISECSRCGLSAKAIAVFHQMKLENITPDSITLLSLLPACADLASLNCGMWVHSIISKTGHESDLFVGSSLIDMYAKCGDIDMGWMVFERMSVKTIVTWNSMIWAYGMHGKAEDADRLFHEMRQVGVNPDVVTFLSLISACSHAGDVEKGHQYIDLMTREYSMSLTKEHCTSIVDLLGRNGHVKEAFEFMEKFPAAAGACAWGALLGACRVQGNIEVGMHAAEKLFELDPLHCGYHVLLANMFSELGRWREASTIRRKLAETGIKKSPGWSIVNT